MTSTETSPAPEAPGADDSAAPRTVLFDFDGVLFASDAFGCFMRHRYRSSLLRKVLALLDLPWFVLCLPFSRWWAMRSLVHAALLGVSEARYRRDAEAFADQLVRTPRQFHRDGLQALRRHLAAGERVLVVTGCEQVLAERILHQLGLPQVPVLGSQLKSGVFGMRLALHNVGKRKVQSLHAHGISAWAVAYGDSMYDVAMLKGAAEPVLVNGNPRLCKRVEKLLGRTVTRVDWH